MIFGGFYKKERIPNYCRKIIYKIASYQGYL